ncbi:MAG: hypothetical protein M1830_001002 [Pleopsidium flavum]|nr:MAG: hypothetical protein M1830_001002 [Pleopsidium flavum]
MPPSSDYPTSQDYQLPDTSPLHQQQAQTNEYGASQKKTRGKRKHEPKREIDNEGRIPKVYPRELTQSPPPLLRQHDSPPPPPPILLDVTESPPLAGLPAPLEFPTNVAAYNTNEWANNVPYGRSPPNAPSNGISISGSPPYFPSSYGDRGGLVGRFNNATPSTSPPTAAPRPSNQINGFHSFGDPMRPAPGMKRRTSTYSQNKSPLPHQQQPHFYGAPDAGLGFPKPRIADSRAGDGSYYCRFDSLASCGHEGSRGAETMIMVASQGTLDVFRIDKQKLKLVGRLEGLRGRVLGAKILPWTSRRDPMKAKRPLVAVVIHGPTALRGTTEVDRPTTSSPQDAPPVIPGTQASNLRTRPSLPADGRRTREITHYQTTVEVYSLRTQECIATLLTCPTSAVTAPVSSPLFSPPLPTGNLKTDANGKYIFIASGTSGEVWIFGLESQNDEPQIGAFTCVGKTWTSIQTSNRRSLSSSSSSADTDYQFKALELGIAPCGSPLVSLSHRWLAIVPPSPASRFSINATALISETSSRPPGLDSHTAPSQPQPTCSVDSPEAESLLNKVAREVTQEVIKGARWVGDQGLQVWKSYWAKPQDHNPPADPFRTSNDAVGPMSRHSQQQFPPTHAHEELVSQSSGDRALVSILDLEKLANAQETRSAVTLTPNATFQTPYGCSCLSFAPSGLMILTASKKGDVQYIWDLMRVLHGKGDNAGTQEISNKSGGGFDSQGPHVRQVARFARMTVASIIDVVWAAPQGERLAIVTEKGTAHIFELPASVLVWPPARRFIRPVTAPGSTTPGDTDHETAIDDKQTINPFASAMNMVNGKAQPLLAAVRSRPPSMSNPFSVVGGFGVTSAVGAKGGKAVAAGFSKSVGAASGTVNTLRHVGENRLHLPGSVDPRTAGSVRWMEGRDRGRIAVVGGGIVKIYGVMHGKGNQKGSRKYPSIVGSRPVEISLPAITDDQVAPAVMDYLREDGDGDDPLQALGGYWSLQTSPGAARNKSKGNPHPLSFAEIETNPPYQPFHTDPRINLFVYDKPQSWESGPEVSQDLRLSTSEIPWVFGEDIPATKIDLGSAVLDEADPGPMENLMTVQKLNDNLEQVVVTTRRRRGRPPTDEEEFFEDDCEVVDFAEDRV